MNMQCLRSKEPLGPPSFVPGGRTRLLGASCPHHVRSVGKVCQDCEFWTSSLEPFVHHFSHVSRPSTQNFTKSGTCHFLLHFHSSSLSTPASINSRTIWAWSARHPASRRGFLAPAFNKTCTVSVKPPSHAAWIGVLLSCKRLVAESTSALAYQGARFERERRYYFRIFHISYYLRKYFVHLPLSQHDFIRAPHLCFMSKHHHPWPLPEAVQSPNGPAKKLHTKLFQQRI